MLTKLGIGSLLVGFFMGVFAGISGFMEKENLWVDLTISKVLGEDQTESIITSINNMTIQGGLDVFMYETPLFGIFLGLGVILLVVGMFFKSH